MKKDTRIAETLISKRQLDKGIKRAARWLNNEYKNKTPIIIGILKGCILFMGKIMPLLNFDFELEFMAISSFRGKTKAKGDIELLLDIKTDVKGRDIIILEDIIDTARSLSLVIKMLEKRHPSSIKLVTLLDKKEGRKVELNADYSCFNIPNKFIVGFGLDYKEIMRNYEMIGCLKEEYINSEE